MEFIKKRWKWVVGAIVALFVILILLAALGAPESPVGGNGDEWDTFRSTGMELMHPAWSRVDQSNISEADKLALAITDGSCAFVVKATPLPPGIAYADFAERRLAVASQKMGTEVMAKKIAEKSSFFDVRLGSGAKSLRNISYDYLTSGGMTYGMGFIADASQFDAVCGPYIEKTIRSVVTR